MPQSLAVRLKQPGLISAPGVFDMISAKITDGMGFDALYMTGYGVVASYLGLPDAGLATYTDMVGRARAIASGTRTPLMADADTGYGGLLNVDFTVKVTRPRACRRSRSKTRNFRRNAGIRLAAA
jgi:2-methylisocitrate lyase-like PEP mutase family enzyme